jgi:GTPase SAR1 family protein
MVRIWRLDPIGLPAPQPTEDSAHHITTKIVLVGESGVGKTGLGWRLAHGTYKEHSSTHGQQFWVLDALQHRRADGALCEGVLWDLAGQPDYRLIHGLFIDDADLAIVVFNPADRHEPLHHVEFWLKVLAHGRERACQTILVGARLDRGEPSLTQAEIDAFCQSHRIPGGYVGTSALTGAGLDALIARIKQQIPWAELPATVTTGTFLRIKEYVLSLKGDRDRKGVLTTPEGLRERLEKHDPKWKFSDAEMMTAVGHLAKHGYVRVLRTASGKESILLSPELLNNLAASFVLEARRNPKGLGALEEARVLAGEYAFPELTDLDGVEREILLDAATTLFLQHNICFREALGPTTFLIFPELINRKKPRIDETPTIDDVSYVVSGAVENVYAALVVLLGYTNTFTRTDQWQNQAQYEVGADEVCGFRQIAEREGELELVLYYGGSVPEHSRRLFQGLFEKFLATRRVAVTRFPPLACPKCEYRQDRAEIVRRTREQKAVVFCSECGARIPLPKAGEALKLTDETHRAVDREQRVAEARTRFEAALVQVKAFARTKRKKAQSCFISYAWGEANHERWVEKRLVTDLKHAGINIVFDRVDNADPGANIARFIERIESAKAVLVVGTRSYLKKYTNKGKRAGTVVAAEVDLINQRMKGTERDKASVRPLLLEGDEKTSFPPLLRGRVYVDFRSEESYFASLFDLILSLYRIKVGDPAVADLRGALRDRRDDASRMLLPGGRNDL